jgi:hypothetical protein
MNLSESRASRRGRKERNGRQGGGSPSATVGWISTTGVGFYRATELRFLRGWDAAMIH